MNSRNNYLKSVLLLWCGFIIYIIINSLFVNFNFECFVRSMYEYCFYSSIMWSGVLICKHYDLKNILKIFCLIGIALSFLSFIEFYFDFYFLKTDNYSTYVEFGGEMITRAKVFTRSYLSHGVLLGLFSLCNYYVYANNKQKLFLFGTIFCFVSILTTGSRGPLISTFIALSFMLVLINSNQIKLYIKNKNLFKVTRFKTIVFIIILICLLMIVFNIQTRIYFIDYSFQRIRSIFNWTGDAGNVGRIEIWLSNLKIFLNNFIFGVGASHTGSWRENLLGVTESDVLKRLVELGIIGFILYYGLILKIFIKGLKDVISKFDSQLVFFLSSVVLVLVDGIILQVTEEIMISFFFWFFIGCILSKSTHFKKSNKLIYYSQVDWYWIKQRPHFIAEGLTQKYDILFVYQHRYNRKIMQKNRNKMKNLKVFSIWVIPKGDRNKYLKILNHCIKKLYISILILIYDANSMIVTYPSQINDVPDFFYGLMIYDCMDNHVEFIEDDSLKSKLEIDENSIIERSNIIFISSDNLGKVLCKRYLCASSKTTYLIRNAYQGEIYDTKLNNSKSSTYNFCYFGTISSWFDFKLILRSLDEFKDIDYYVYGPIEDGIQIPSHERLHIMGVVEHNKLFDIVDNMDCLIMPFIVTELIESVDPVKLYEYINFNKNILSVYYDEIKRFQPFVHFYKTEEEFISQIQELKNNQQLKYSSEQRENFLKNNNWESRIKDIESILEKYI